MISGRGIDVGKVHRVLECGRRPCKFLSSGLGASRSPLVGMSVCLSVENLSPLASYNETIVNVNLSHLLNNLSHLALQILSNVYFVSSLDLSQLADDLSHLALQILSNVYFVSSLYLSQPTLQIVMHLETIVNAKLIYPTL